MIRIAMIKKPNNELHIKAFAAQDVEDAQQAARDWVAKNFGCGDDVKIVYPEFCLPVIEYFITHDAENADAPVVHSRVLSDEDREFLAGCLVSMEDLRTPCCGGGQHPNAVPTADAVKQLEDLRDSSKPQTRKNNDTA